MTELKLPDISINSPSPYQFSLSKNLSKAKKE